MQNFNPEDFKFNLRDVQSRVSWLLGDAKVDDLLLIDAPIDLISDEVEVSLSDIFLACGREIALIALTTSKNKRAHLAIILPTIAAFASETTDLRILQAIDILKKWVDGFDVTDFEAVHASCKDVLDEINSGMPYDESNSKRPLGMWDMPGLDKNGIMSRSPMIYPPTETITTIVLETIKYAGNLNKFRPEHEFHRNPELYFPQEVVEKIYNQEPSYRKKIGSERRRDEKRRTLRFTVNILFLSPPLALFK